MAVAKVFLGALFGSIAAVVAGTVGLIVFIGLSAGADQSGWGLIIMMFGSIILIPAYFFGILIAQGLARATQTGMTGVVVLSALAPAVLAFLATKGISNDDGAAFAVLLGVVAAFSGAVGGFVSGLVNREPRGMYGHG